MNKFIVYLRSKIQQRIFCLIENNSKCGIKQNSEHLRTYDLCRCPSIRSTGPKVRTKDTPARCRIPSLPQFRGRCEPWTCSWPLLRTTRNKPTTRTNRLHTGQLLKQYVSDDLELKLRLIENLVSFYLKKNIFLQIEIVSKKI